jgi:prephenate dehydrogenase
MDFKNITIIGVGLIGGSLALALKKKGYKGRITGVGRNKKNLIRALELGIIDDYSTVHSQGVKYADLVIIAASVGQFEEIAKKINNHLKKGAIVTDVGSVKSRIINIIEPLMPEGVFFVGGHPIAGKECSGLEGATPDLFHNARCIITPSANTKRAAMNKVKSLWKMVGMKTVIMTPEEHDQVFAAVSHMPHIVAYTIVNSILDADRKFMRYGGRGLKDITRIAMSSEELWRDICSSNREDILSTLRKFSSSVSRMIKLFEKSDWKGLEGEFKRAREARKLIESD